jgi:hypothetical protein
VCPLRAADCEFAADAEGFPVVGDMRDRCGDDPGALDARVG